MALSGKVTEALSEAEGSLRNALSSAARQERPMVCAGISDVLQRLESLMSMDDILDKMESQGTFFGSPRTDGNA